MNFKYQTEITTLIKQGFDLPSLEIPENKNNYRFIHNCSHPNNHKPQYRLFPQRVLPSNHKRLTIGFALSCFDSEYQSIEHYNKFKKIHKNFCNTVGDSLCKGVLLNNDGEITESNKCGHFSFFEFDNFDPFTKYFFVRQIS